MPAFGDPNAPVHTHVAPRYIGESGEEVGIPNIVTSVLASYRGFDTLGEVTVVFTALIGRVAFAWNQSRISTRLIMSVRKNPILRETSHLLIPAILLFALYVQFHGDYGPGGGFQAGVIFASAIILYALLHGTRRAEKVISLTVAKDVCRYWLAALCRCRRCRHVVGRQLS